MARSVLNRGSAANDGTGDNLRNGADKINANFSEIYSVLGDGNNLLTEDIDFGQNKIFFSNTVARQTDLAGLDASKYVGMIVHAQNTGSLYYAHSGTWRKLLTDNSSGSTPSYTDPLDNVAYTGNYNDLSNRPAIPSRLTDVGITDGSAGQVLTTDGTGNFTFRDVEATTVGFNNITNKPTTLAGYGINDAFTGRYEDLLNKPTLFSGSYNDLTNKPSVPTDVDDLTDNSNLLFDGEYASLNGRPTIPSDVSSLTDTTNRFFSRSYNDLTNKPNAFENLVSLSMELGVTVDEFSNDTAMTDNSATALVTERAVKTYIANQLATLPGLPTTFDGDITGSVFADDSTLLVDGVEGLIVGDVNNTEVNSDFIYFRNTGYQLFSDEGGDFYIRGSSTDGNIIIRTNASGGGQENFVFGKNGNLTVPTGTTITPENKTSGLPEDFIIRGQQTSGTSLSEGGNLYIDGGQGNTGEGYASGGLWLGTESALVRIGNLSGGTITEIDGYARLLPGSELDFQGQSTLTNLSSITTDLTGSVFADDSTILVDGVAGKIVGEVDNNNVYTNFIEPQAENSQLQIGDGNTSGGETVVIATQNVRIIAAVPSTSIGVSGDLVGSIAFDGTYMYYCTAAYDGGTNIWKRVAWSGDTW